MNPIVDMYAGITLPVSYDLLIAWYPAARGGFVGSRSRVPNCFSNTTWLNSCRTKRHSRSRLSGWRWHALDLNTELRSK